MEVRFSVHTKIQKPVEQVFDAVRNPDKLSQYFATGGASGPLEEGSKVTWRWAEFPGAVGDVSVTRVVPNRRIAFQWKSSDGNSTLTTEIQFEPLGSGDCLKAWIEYGINLHKGAYGKES